MILVILGLLFVFYGLSIGYKNSGTVFYFIWFVFGALCVLIERFNYFHYWEKIPDFILKCLIGLMAIFFLYVSLMLIIIFIHSKSKGKPNADYIIVLGAQWKKEGPCKALKYRLDVAYDYLEKNPQTKCIVSGGQGYNEPISEALGMSNVLMQRGIEKERILLEDCSTSTIENITFSKRFMNSDSCSVGIVTNGFHVFRSVFVARNLGLKNSFGIAGKSGFYYLPNNALRETFGFVKDYVFMKFDL